MSIKSYALRVFKNLRWLAPAAALFVLAFVFASGSFSRNQDPEPRAEEKKSSRPDKITQLESEIITATTRGFEPTEITRPQGKFILMVDNRSGEEMNFRLARDTGESLHEIRSSQAELDWNEVMDLKPGRYVLSERDRPDLSVIIRINAH